MNEFEQLLQTIQRIADSRANVNTPRDAIDIELSSARRTTDVVSVKDSPEVQAFQTSVVDALIANDAARQALTLINTLLTRIFPV